MQYIINTGDSTPLDWGATGDNRVIQNVRNLFSTWRYEVAFDRTKGVDPSIMDRPAPEAAALYMAEMPRLVNTYEPRAKFVSADWMGLDDEGNLIFRVVIEI